MTNEKKFTRRQVWVFTIVIAIAISVIFIGNYAEHGWWALVITPIELLIVLLIILGLNKLFEWADSDEG